MNKHRAPRNQTLVCEAQEIAVLKKQFLRLHKPVCINQARNRIINQDLFEVIHHLPDSFADLLILDPPYNLSKDYNGQPFRQKTKQDYATWFENMLQIIKRTLKKHASVYVCADWKTSVIIAPLLERHFYVQNRITWERGKGRGAKSNWKNNIEDIWFCSVSKELFFNVDAVKLKRKVVAPYRQANGQPKDWNEEAHGNYRLTHPSNLWTDISIPFWSMPENTDHPTQKPEKLIAKLLLASSRKGDTVFDPFCGSGTTAVVAKKLHRDFVAVEINEEYCCWSAKRLQRANADDAIQGYADKVFWERNTQINRQTPKHNIIRTRRLF